MPALLIAWWKKKKRWQPTRAEAWQATPHPTGSQLVLTKLSIFQNFMRPASPMMQNTASTRIMQTLREGSASKSRTCRHNDPLACAGSVTSTGLAQRIGPAMPTIQRLAGPKYMVVYVIAVRPTTKRDNPNIAQPQGIPKRLRLRTPQLSPPHSTQKTQPTPKPKEIKRCSRK